MIRAAVHPLRGTRGNAEDILAALERNVGLSSDPFVELPLACGLAAAYVALGLAGNRLMESREPLQLTGPKLVYNLTQIVVCAVTFWRLLPYFVVRLTPLAASPPSPPLPSAADPVGLVVAERGARLRPEHRAERDG